VTAAQRSMLAKRFGQSAVATPANFVTVVRILVAIPTLALIRRDGSSWVTLGLWFAITATDSLDGWLARRDGATRSGAFLEAAALDWAGFFPFSPEDGTPAASLPDAAPAELVHEWLRECDAVQEPITRSARDALIGAEVDVLVDRVAPAGDGVVGRTHREAPEIDGVVRVDGAYARPGAVVRAHVTEAVGPDLVAKVAP